MQLPLSDLEAHEVHDLLHVYLPLLRRTVARTDATEFRHLVHRLDRVKRIVADLALIRVR